MPSSRDGPRESKYSDAQAKVLVITQSDYIPWKGYFDLISHANDCIMLDDVQYTTRDWRNRNRIKTPHGITWLTIPVRNRGKREQLINEAWPLNDEWIDKHWKTLEMSYHRAPSFAVVAPMIRNWYESCYGKSLSAINRIFLEGICSFLGIATRFSSSDEFPHTGTKGGRIVNLCVQAGATVYLSGPAARSYLDPHDFIKQNIQLQFFRYGSYPEYPQLYPPFEHRVSIVDVLFHMGELAAHFIHAESIES